ncbi:hypothetical protein MKEN_00336700 [Mycena kentingensis (nom. inval.)]|nr:hypothetical protein MKEN_00336700 [Mycena kentingensis (nom. inval.)]
MYDPSTSKRDEPPTVLIQPVYVGVGTFLCVLFSSCLPYKISPDMSWILVLLMVGAKLYTFSLIALMHCAFFFFGAASFTPAQVALFYDHMPEDGLLVSVAVGFVCDLAAFQLTKRCGRPPFIAEDEGLGAVDDPANLNPSHSA